MVETSPLDRMFHAVFRIRRIRKFLGLPDPDSFLFYGSVPDMDPNPSIIQAKN